MGNEEIKKVCKKCKEEKALVNFKKNIKLKTGYEGSCKSCVKIRDVKNRKKVIDSKKESVDFKTCRSCTTEKEICEFSINLSKKDGYDIYCRACLKIKSSKIRGSLKNTPDCKKCNKCEEIKDKSCFNKTNSSIDNLCYLCKECLSISNKEKYKVTREINLEKQSARRKIHKQNNPEQLKEKDRKAREKNKEYSKDYSKIYSKNRRLEDPLFKLAGNLRTRIKTSFLKANHNKTSKTKDIIGCSWEEFKNHIESQFLNWMTWENYGNCETNEYECSWHLDHIIPISYAKTEEDVYLLNHWSNFQPLCSKTNLEKNKTLRSVYNLELGIEATE